MWQWQKLKEKKLLFWLCSWARGKLSKFALKSRGARSQNDLSVSRVRNVSWVQWQWNAEAQTVTETGAQWSGQHGTLAWRRYEVLDTKMIMHNPGLKNIGMVQCVLLCYCVPSEIGKRKNNGGLFFWCPGKRCMVVGYKNIWTELDVWRSHDAFF